MRWVKSLVLVDTIEYVWICGKLKNQARDYWTRFAEHGARILAQIVETTVHKTAPYTP